MIQIDGSVFIQIANFLFLIWALNTVLYKPLRHIVRQRKEKVEGFQMNIESFEKSALEKDASYAAGIKDARALGMKEKEAMAAEASAKEKEIIERINQKAREELTGLRDKIARDARTVKGTLEKEVDGYAEAIAQKILGRTV